MSSGFDGRDSVFEPIATQLIAEWYGWNESSLAALEESQEATLEDMRLGYPQRTIHLANEYSMERKTWNLENHLKVFISKIQFVHDIQNYLQQYGEWSEPNGHSPRYYPVKNDIVSIYRKFFK